MQDSNKVPRPIFDAIRSRRSIRAYLPTPVPMEMVREMLELGARAPSGSNLQPWKVHVLTGDSLQRLGAAIQSAYLSDEPGHKRDYNYYTDPIVEPYLARRRATGWGLYGTLGIQKSEKGRMKQARSRNYNFFSAPLGLVCTIDSALEKGSWLDYGMFLQTIMIAARVFGLHTCAEASIGEFPNIVRSHLGLAADNLVVCGMAVGYADPGAVINSFQPARVTLDEFVTFHT